jgi:hypothetical protein
MLLYDQPGTVRVVASRKTVGIIEGRITVEASPPHDVRVIFTPTSPEIRKRGWTYDPADDRQHTVRAEVRDLAGTVIAFLWDDDKVMEPGSTLVVTF